MLIAIEGVDASGKETQTELLRVRAERAGLAVVTLSFPRYGETLFARCVSDYLGGRFGDKESTSPYAVALLYAGDRMESLPRLYDLIGKHDLVILDRYIASNAAYQGAKLPPAQRREIVEWIGRVEHDALGLPWPELTILLDVPIAVSAERLRARRIQKGALTGADIHESDMEFLEATRGVYQDMAEAEFGGRWTVIPGVDSAGGVRDRDAIAESVWQAVESALALRTAG